MNKLNHFDETGQAHMVDIGYKTPTKRRAIARGLIRVSAQSICFLQPNSNPKGDVLGVARIAAIQGAKQTPSLIPLCHPVALTHVHAEFTLEEAERALWLQVTTETTGGTGVEMEALSAVSVGLLTVYDMLKAADKGLSIESIQLVSKEGGKSGVWTRPGI